MKRLLPAMLMAFWILHAVAADKEPWQSPATVDGATTIDVATAERLHAEGVPFVDVRNPRLFQRKHIPGAHHLDLKTAFNEQALRAVAAPDRPLVIYCSGAHCSRSSKASALAVGWGFREVRYFRDGIRGWKQAGLPMQFADEVRPADTGPVPAQ